MKERAKKILDFIIKNNNVTSQELQERFNDFKENYLLRYSSYK